MSILTAEDLLVGGEATHRIEVPAHLVTTGADAGVDGSGVDGSEDDGPDVDALDDPASAGRTEVVFRPLLLADIVRLQRATAHDEHLASVLMVQQALVEPALTVEQVHRLPAGLVEFLLAETNRVSGLSLTADDLRSLVHDPVAKACVVLAREFGWTPDTCAELTVGQLLLYLEMIERGERP